MKAAPITTFIGCVCLTVYPWRIYNNLSLGLFSLHPSNIIHGKQLYRVLTCRFFHGDLIHLGSNMYSLSQMGPLLERKWGSRKYALVVSTGMIIMPCVKCAIDILLSMIGHHDLREKQGSIGLSGILFQLTTLYAFTTDSSATVNCFGITMPVRVQPFVSIFLSSVAGQAARRSVSFWGHVAGIATGLLQLPFIKTMQKGRAQQKQCLFPGQGNRLGESGTASSQATSAIVERQQRNHLGGQATSVRMERRQAR